VYAPRFQGPSDSLPASSPCVATGVPLQNYAGMTRAASANFFAWSVVMTCPAGYSQSAQETRSPGAMLPVNAIVVGMATLLFADKH